MPIKFRCPHCRQFLGISRSKAGEVADCPMCGKTLRVPNLDGKVKPLPKPKLDLKDSSLVNALGELASIGSEETSNATLDADVRASPKQSAPPVPRSTPAPKPIVLEPLVPAEPVVVHTQPRAPGKRTSQETASSVSADEGTLDDPKLPVPESSTPHIFGKETSSPAATATSRTWIPIAVVVGLFLLGGMGLLVMNGSQPTGAAAQEEAADDAPATDRAVAAPPGTDGTAAVTGRVTYVSEAGDSRPDDGAKVIALPADRRGTVMLDVTGFLVGADDVDTQVATASLIALGGSLVTADDRGEFAVTLPEAGDYKLLVISRHQSRPWEVGVEEDVQELLARFFIRPSTLLGQLAYDVQDFQYRGQGTSPRDVAFGRQE